MYKSFFQNDQKIEDGDGDALSDTGIEESTSSKEVPSDDEHLREGPIIVIEGEQGTENGGSQKADMYSRQPDGRSEKAEEGSDDEADSREAENGEQHAFFLLHEKSKLFLEELKASDDRTLSLLNSFQPQEEISTHRKL